MIKKLLLIVIGFNLFLYSATLEEKVTGINKKLLSRTFKERDIANLSILNIYLEKFKKANENFKKLYKINKDSFSLFYVALTESYYAPQEAIRSWDLYFLESNAASKKLWINLGVLVRGIIQHHDQQDQKLLKERIIFFYLNEASYTTMILANIYEKYIIFSKAKKNLEEINFIARIKAGILSKKGYGLNAIKLYENYAAKYALNSTGLLKLGTLYYKNNFYIQALETFKKIKDTKNESILLEYYTALAYLKLNERDNFELYKKKLKSKIKTEKDNKIYQKLKANSLLNI